MTASADADDEAGQEAASDKLPACRSLDRQPIGAAATPRQAGSLSDNEGARVPGIDEFDRNEIVAAIRDVFEANAELDRETATREVARKLGFARTGNRIAEAIDSALIAAVKRGVVKNERGWLSLDCREIGHYRRELLFDALLAAMGRGWTERDEAIVAATRHLGFRRTGAAIKETFKSVINGAIRRGLLEYDGSQIRKAAST